MKTNETTIQLRVDSKTKKQFQKTVDDIGLDVSSAIKLFLKSVITTESIPFEIRTKNGYTLKQEQEMKKEVEWAIENGKRYSSAKELHRDLISSK